MRLDVLPSLLAALVVLLIGTFVNRRVAVLSRYNIPDPITGGLLFALLAALVAAATGFRLEVDQAFKPLLLLMFFAGVGMSADLRMLGRGGKALVLFLLVLLPFILVQNVVGVIVASVLDLHPIYGLVAGSITLVGGHGTGAAYAQRFSDVNNLQSVMDLTMTAATVALVIGGIIGGPVAQWLLQTRGIQPKEAADRAVPGDPAEPARAAPSTAGFAGALAGIFAAVVGGQWLEARVAGGPVTLPGFLWCMLLGIAIRNLAPFARLRIADSASDLVAGICLSLFLVLTMMALELAQVARAAGPLMTIVAAQVVVAVLYARYVCFRVMGRDYEAAVTSGAFIGFCMGSTATAMANMQAITARYGPAPQSYLVVPLAGAFFIDLINAVLLAFTLPFVGG